MSVDVIMPQMGESIAEGTVTKWLKKVGDAVKRDEPLFEISTDKVDAEIPSPSAGVLQEILVGEGKTVGVNTVVARIGEASAREAPRQEKGAAEPSPKAATLAEGAREARPGGSPPPREAAPAGESARPGLKGESRAAAEGNGGRDLSESSREELRRTRSSPVVRKMAAEHGIDISSLEGTGISGRVTKQ
ncbi:MAG TPA: biotin/lipoyl-containing protein, partial [Candidatus Polarisedimenticolia bacterium]|nr:biotin/lipoyl-containing protein [Candidatus Polarisedimenticolia bacterium]